MLLSPALLAAFSFFPWPLEPSYLAFFGCLFVTLKGAWFLLLFGGFPDPCRHLICHLISCNYSCGVGDQIPFLVFPQGFL